MKVLVLTFAALALLSSPASSQTRVRQSTLTTPDFRYSRTPSTLEQLENSDTRIRTFGSQQGHSNSVGILNGETFRSRSYQSPYGRGRTNGTISGQRFSCQSNRVLYSRTASRCR